MTSEDPQKIFCLLVLAINFSCFVIITACYVLISTKAAMSARNISRNSNNSQGLQLKITAIIFTDFLCWIPLTVVCFLHYGEVIDAAQWYPFFSITLLPINSVINPILYNAKIVTNLVTPIRWTVRRVLKWRKNSRIEAAVQGGVKEGY